MSTLHVARLCFRRPMRRRGAIYMLVLISALIVGAIGLAAVQLMRVQGSVAADGNNFNEARILAGSALEIGMLKIRNDPYWRTNMGNGAWVTNQPLGNGTYSLSAVDPVDNDVAKGDNHPVVLTGTGMKGGAVFQASVRLEVGPPAGSCLEVSMISGNNTSLSTATLTSDQTVCANAQFSANGSSTVNANVEALSSISGSGIYAKSKAILPAARSMPNSSTVLNYYLANGTTIPYTDLPLWSQSQILTNTTFETDVSGWYPFWSSCVLSRSSAKKLGGLYSMLVSSRADANATAAQSIPVGLLTCGNKYQLSVPFYPTASCSAAAYLVLVSTGDGVQYFATSTSSASAGAWKTLSSNSIQPTWTGTLTWAAVSIWVNVQNDFYMDNVSLTDLTYGTSTYVMDRVLLSPSVNPFGSGQTNPQGIYIINCGGKDVAVAKARIVGTLLFVNPGGNSIIQGPVIWEPAVYNYPALLSDNKLQIGFDSSASLDEAAYGLNLNPPGTPYPFIGGTENGTLTESYPCKMTGLVYSKNDWTFSGAPSISGVVITDQKINVNAKSLNLNYVNTYLNDPPPGFVAGTITMKAVPGTWQRKVN